MRMSSRERVLAAVNHREPDRVPIDLGGSPATSIEPGLYIRLREQLGVEGAAEQHPVVGQPHLFEDQGGELGRAALLGVKRGQGRIVGLYVGAKTRNH